MASRGLTGGGKRGLRRGGGARPLKARKNRGAECERSAFGCGVQSAERKPSHQRERRCGGSVGRAGRVRARNSSASSSAIRGVVSTQLRAGKRRRRGAPLASCA